MLDGCKVHAVIIKTGFSFNIFIQNSLIDMYFKFDNLDIAQLLFDEMLVRDVVSWNTLVAGYSLCGNVELAKRVFDKMPIKNLVSWSAMIAGYSQSGDLEAAHQLFDVMPERNMVSWNAMIAGYAQNEKYANAINIFHEMQKTNSVRPNNVTLISVLSACAHLSAFDLEKWTDHFISRSGMELSLFLGNALVDIYAKCGFVAEARRIFDKMQERDVISWSIIISGLAMHGHAEEAIDYFFEMLECGIKLNEVTFMGLLSACTHAGLVDTGLKYFNMMDHKYGITPKIEHYGCVVDLLSRVEHLIEAEDLINSMPIERGERVVQHILELDSEHSGSYVYLANVYASVGHLDDAAKCRLNIRENRIIKTPGCSWIEVHNTVHEFFMGDKSHPQADKIYATISDF
ncbi:pentatricopeptide repeat-containing protein At2g44880-like [Macadamia integrifolia]|uniref:pentatricopeptide repeat-containing protein At2g44880-like n=1 Tax=Macadamia integrifolia TaxID=60698 RepID=UPI001C4E36C5|nr:pentatricopeptide repeat-containing protein At2g44880-like [Macadamia integrifolia]